MPTIIFLPRTDKLFTFQPGIPTPHNAIKHVDADQFLSHLIQNSLRTHIFQYSIIMHVPRRIVPVPIHL